MAAAAIFDLDRTLIRGSSAPIFQKHLHEVGLGTGRDNPLMQQVSNGVFKVFEVFGETWTSMQPAKLFAGTSKGWPLDLVQQAATAAAHELVAMVAGHVPALIEEHRAAGRLVVMATTSPDHLVRPLAELLGFHDVVATRWASDDGTTFAGRVDGPFVWGRGKHLAVKEWAERSGIDLRESYAYSDSFFDAPLLAAVGHPTAVNPDPRLAVLAAVRGWPVRHLDVSPGVVKVAGREVQDWVRPFNRPELWPNAAFRFEGVENIPATGPAIVVFNHRSYFDSVAMGLLMSRSGRAARFLGKKEVFDAPVVGQIAKAVGGIRVVRASGSDEPLEAAAAALRAGEVVCMAPQGTIPRGPAFFEPELKARWGAARLAEMSGAPVIPVGLWGTEKVWPRNSRAPKFNGRPEVSVTVGRPVRITSSDPDVATKEIMAAIVAVLPPEARQRRVPTPEELAATFPPGYKGDVTKESDRRPGTDSVAESAPVRARTVSAPTKKAPVKKAPAAKKAASPAKKAAPVTKKAAPRKASAAKKAAAPAKKRGTRS